MNRAGTWSVAALLALASIRANAMVHVRCRDAFIFPEARVNVVVLPYEYAVPGHEEFVKTGQGLSLLVQMNALSAILKYESVGAVELIDDDLCQRDDIWERLLQQAVAKRNGVVMVWGRIFVDNDQIYEQTFVRFARGGTAEEQWAITARDRLFQGTLSAQALAFPVQTFSQADLKEIAKLTSKYDLLRSAPNDNAPGRPLGPDLAKCAGCSDPGRPTSYVILDQKGPWSHVRNASGQEGWLKLNTGFGSGPLAAKMPEIYFIDGVTGFLQSRIAPANLGGSFSRVADVALSSYIKEAGRESPTSGSVVAQEMRALMVAGRNDSDIADRAVGFLNEALEVSPSDADVHNLLALARLDRWTVTKKPESQSQLAQQFISAAILDPSRNRALSNLKEFFGLTLKDDPAEASWEDRITKDEMTAQLKLIESILEKRAAR